MLPLGTTGQAALRVRRQHVPQGKQSLLVTELKRTMRQVAHHRPLPSALTRQQLSAHATQLLLAANLAHYRPKVQIRSPLCAHPGKAAHLRLSAHFDLEICHLGAIPTLGIAPMLLRRV